MKDKKNCSLCGEEALNRDIEMCVNGINMSRVFEMIFNKMLENNIEIDPEVVKKAIASLEDPQDQKRLERFLK